MKLEYTSPELKLLGFVSKTELANGSFDYDEALGGGSQNGPEGSAGFQEGDIDIEL